jgi:hypothetical protein
MSVNITKPHVLAPVRTREVKGDYRPTSVRMSPQLYDWCVKAAYMQGMSMSSFLRIAARNEADRVMGYNRAQRVNNRRPVRPSFPDAKDEQS